MKKVVNYQNPIEEGYEFKFGNYFTKGGEIFNENMGGFIGYNFLSFLILIVVGMIPFLSSLSNLFSPILYAGIYLMAYSVSNKNGKEFNIFFKGFNYTGNMILLTIVTGLISLICMAPFFYFFLNTIPFSSLLEVGRSVDPDLYADLGTSMAENISENSGAFIGSLILSICLAVYFGVAYFYSTFFVVIGEMKFWDSMEASRKIISQKWFNFFGLLFVVGLINVAGAMLLGFGLLFTIPYSMCILYASFEDIAMEVQTEENQEWSENDNLLDA